jgi:hypothetical protein
VLLAVELLLFEWKPRSAIPVALASATAGAARRYILGFGSLFPLPQHAIFFIGPHGLAGCLLRVCWPAESPVCSPLVFTRRKTASADEPLRAVAFRMAETGLTRMPVVDRVTESLAWFLCATC